METRLLAGPPLEPDDLEKALLRLRRMVESGDVTEARAYVNDLGARWPNDPRVQHWVQVLEPPRVTRRGPSVGRSYRAEWDWVQDHAHEYPGCWIAVYRDHLVAADPDPSVVRREVRAHPEWPHPLLHFEPERSE